MDACLVAYEGCHEDITRCGRAAVAELSRSDRSEEACVRAVVAVTMYAAKARYNVRLACNAARAFGDWMRAVAERSRRTSGRVPSAVSVARWRRVSLACARAFPALVDAMTDMLPVNVRRSTARAWIESGLCEAVERSVAMPGSCRACLGTGWSDLGARVSDPVHCVGVSDACASYSLTAHLVSGDRPPRAGWSPAAAVVDACVAEYARAPPAATVLELALDSVDGSAPSDLRDARRAAFAVATAGHVAALPREKTAVGAAASMEEFVRRGGARVGVPATSDARMLRRAIVVADGAVVASLAEELDEWCSLERALELDYGDCMHYHLTAVDWEWCRAFGGRA